MEKGRSLCYVPPPKETKLINKYLVEKEVNKLLLYCTKIRGGGAGYEKKEIDFFLLIKEQNKRQLHNIIK